MSWLFGKKKHQKDLPPDTTEQEQPSDPSDTFVCIEKKVTSEDSPGNGQQYPQGNLYPYIGGGTPYPLLPTNNLAKQNGQESVNYLSGVPFKLCKTLEYNMNSDLEIDSLRINEILSYIERIENQNYDYDFSIEQSVVAEMSSRD